MAEDTRSYKPVMTADEFRAWVVMTLEFLALMASFIAIWPTLPWFVYVVAALVGGLLVRGTFSITKSRAE